MASNLQKWFENRSPFRGLSNMEDPFDRLMNELMNMKRNGGLGSFEFSPSCDLAEEENQYIATFDLPGVNKDQVKVEVDNNQITVSAERKEEKKKDTKRTHLSEIHYGSYQRSFTIPGTIDEKKIDAKFENGVLTLIVPKTESSKLKQIPVH
ncbi:Hsp20/alpha crystallin family protein [Bdellovibrio sp. KM01]|uniref:Hsp20/alpha crystallin family protein n=1 Tax=Bdellovibrio sp. KM01 TaxID=2748865 RepID=UPI0015EABDDD|nr:Hsp20/alpha crystallin family protein [Bdellovibrio sp. KM01]QLY26404.1 Hsp20/alpha crystallin family protein [Bdellovibrio sp. KM01]